MVLQQAPAREAGQNQPEPQLVFEQNQPKLNLMFRRITQQCLFMFNHMIDI